MPPCTTFSTCTNHNAAGVFRGLALGGGVQRTDFPVDGAVAVLVGIGGPDQADVNGDRLYRAAAPCPSSSTSFTRSSRGDVVELAAAAAGVYKRVQPHMGDGADVVGGDVPVAGG